MLVDCGYILVILKENDPRLTKSLTMGEFNIAFGMFKVIVCEVNPDRRKELDTYLEIILDLSNTTNHFYLKQQCIFKALISDWTGPWSILLILAGTLWATEHCHAHSAVCFPTPLLSALRSLQLRTLPTLTVRDLFSLLGHLNFAMRIIP